MNTLLWIVLSTASMSLLAWIGLLALPLRETALKKILLPLIAFSAGSMIGAAFLHLIPEAINRSGPELDIFIWVLVGFSIFFLMEQFLAWHHHHDVISEHKEPFTYLILISDALHNFIGGLAIGASFLVSVKVGIITCIAAAFHEIPQELGDFGILLRGGWDKYKALLFNFLAACTIIPGGVAAYWGAEIIDMTFLLPLAAGNFIYVAASDLIPEIKHESSMRVNLGHFGAFLLGISLIFLTRIIL